jgi:hypothetical protein
VSARECPDGTARLGLMIPVALIVMGVGTGLYATRGPAPGSEGNGLRVNAVILAWCAIFLGISFACFWGVWGPDANPGPGGKEGGLIVAFLFVLMGGGALPFLLRRRESRFGKQAAMGRIVDRVAPSGGGGDVVSKLERANRLRAEGALTEAEFEKLKAEILGGGG